MSNELKCNADMGDGRYLSVDSPIEKIFAETLAWFISRECLPELTNIQNQYQLEQYRYDFAIHLGTSEDKFPDLLIECDGREFHSTPAQIENDLSKTSLAAQHGIRLLRFTGWDLHVRSELCVYSLIIAAKEVLKNKAVKERDFRQWAAKGTRDYQDDAQIAVVL